MPKSKDSPALFEVFRESRLKQRTDAPSREDSVSGLPQSAEQDAGVEPWLRTRGDRIRFSISTLVLSVAIFSLALLLVASYEIGRRVGIASSATLGAEWAADDPDGLLTIRENKPKPDVLSDIIGLEQALAVEQAREEREHNQQVHAQQRPANLNYILVDAFANEEDAQDAGVFLENVGIEVSPSQINGRWYLITRQGFDYRIPEEKQACKQLLSRLKQLGKDYLDAGGRYQFNGLIRKKLPGEQW